MAPTSSLAVGIDLGTSGVRAIAIDGGRKVRAQAARAMPAPEAVEGAIRQDPAIWWRTVEAALGDLVAMTGPGRITSLAVDGTSGTLLLTDAAGRPLEPARMYNDASAAHLAARIREVAPPESGAHGATSPLARLLVLQERHPEAAHALHQADWIAGNLLGRHGLSDDNNALKSGWDPVARRWPDWLDRLGVRRDLLPAVRTPASSFGTVDPAVADRLGLAPGCAVIAGTTDGCASFLATGAAEIGDGVSALGSTLTIKLLSDRPVSAPDHGVYSHRLGDIWLVGGASNSGGKALLRFLSAERMAELTPRLDPDHPTGLHWHPLPGRGERFPIADPALTFAPDPLPEDQLRLFQGLLEGIAEVEALAYRRIAELGGPALRSVRSVGGGAANPGWTRIRARLLGVPLLPAAQLEAAYGTALLALQGTAGG
jgi:sugar (pentulose or hexulose) kinase